MRDHGRGEWVLSPGGVRSTILAELFAHWTSLRGGSTPARSDFDPMRVPSLLPNVFLLRREPASVRFRIRVLGTRLCALIGRDLTGQYLDDARLPNDIQRSIAAEAGSGVPFAMGGELALSDDIISRYEVLGLPMASDAGAETYLLGAMDFDQPRRRRALDEAPAEMC